MIRPIAIALFAALAVTPSFAASGSVQPVLRTGRVAYGSKYNTMTSTTAVTIDTTTAKMTVQDIQVNGSLSGSPATLSPGDFMLSISSAGTVNQCTLDTYGNMTLTGNVTANGVLLGAGAQWGSITGTIADQTDLSSTYLTQSVAAANYLLQSSAVNNYGQLAATQTWTGSNTFINPVILSNGSITTSSVTVQGVGAGEIDLYEDVAPSAIAGSDVLWGTMRAIGSSLRRTIPQPI